jgi:predicted short-subunit dehydrogenase-like oxidoreductase (DUF2520 family)
MRELERDSTSAASGGLNWSSPLALIGPGRVGRSIAAAADRAGVAVDLAGRDRALDACRKAEVALLCVPDAAIGDACAALAPAVPPLRFVGHVSGATTLDALQPARGRGAEVFSMHPLQTIPDGGAELAGAPCVIAGSGEGAVRLAGGLAARLGMRPFEVPEESRAAYHAAAAMASNLLVALEESAADLLARLGVEETRELLAPLVLRTAANWAELGEAALTGPIARGDEATVDRHLAALREAAPDLVPVYEALSARAREIARRGAEAAA